MGKFPVTYIPIKGRTYTLFGAGDSTLAYYQAIEHLTNDILEKYSDLNFVLRTIQSNSGRKSLLKKVIAHPDAALPISFILNKITDILNEYTLDVEAYLKTLPFFKIGDRGLKTTRLQYHLYMLEIELTNKLYAKSFISADRKIALLPHCLRDLTVECKAAPNGFDYKCLHCSGICYQNAVTTILAKNGIDAYIWKGADLRKEAKLLIKSGMTVGVLGIACIPELIDGMRTCQKYSLPVIGLPLDANRCIRWFGEFHPNSVNLEILEKLVSKI